ncbi:hypothetical protein BH11BAC2_BH11BAC2_00370 [soil metagenome]
MKQILCKLICLILLSSSLSAQEDYRLMLLSGTMQPEPNLSAVVFSGSSTDLFNGYYYRYLQFYAVPTQAQKDNISQSGIILMDYVPHNTFMAAIPERYTLAQLSAFGIRSVIQPDAVQKTGRNLLGELPPYAVVEKGTVDLSVQHQGNISEELALAVARKSGKVISYNPSTRTFHLRISDQEILTLAAKPWVFYVSTLSPPSTPDDTKGRSLHRSNAINGAYVSGLHYDGTGVVAGLADDGEVGPHIDFTGRMTNHVLGAGGSHGDMTSGILAGCGNLNPSIAGMGNGAYLHVYDINGPSSNGSDYPHIRDAVINYTSLGTVITSTSYSQGCNVYDNDTQLGDQLIHDNPQLEFVFSAGNNGSGDCGYGAGNGWGNITGGFKQGKNVIACGNLSPLEVLDPSSSRGPAADGRIKPDICANGLDQLSTDQNNTYQVGGGTSAACPGTAGILTQLFQAYKELNGGTTPPSALIKAAVLNTGEDIGNPGPDYTYGWGRINALRAFKTLQNNTYFNASLVQGASNTHIITVPSGVNQVRAMVYWHDVEGSTAASQALVNDLDMSVTDPSSTSFSPWVLNPAPVAATLSAPAVRGVDHLNNMEQVTLDNPTAGSYTVTVNGTTIPTGSQEYYLVYEFRTDEITVTYPQGGEGFVPGESEVIRWDAPKNANSFTLEYSTNAGSSWNTITTVAGTTLQYSWTIPSVISGEALVRVSRGAASDQSDTSFTIIGVPQNLVVDWACPDSVRLIWDSVAGASSYTVYMLGNKYMDVAATSNTTNAILSGINPNDEKWFSVSANTVSGSNGRRALAIKKDPGVFGCPLALDAQITTLLSPVSGTRQDCQDNSAVIVTVLVANRGLTPLTGIPIYYSLNNGPAISDIVSGTMAPLATQNFSFSVPINLSALGTYSLSVWIDYPGDLNLYNDSSSATISIIPGVQGLIPYAEDFQSGVFPPNGWYVVSAGGGYTWIPIQVTGSAGTITDASFIENFAYNNVAAEDAMTTVSFDLTNAISPLLTFDVAYARYSSAYSDALRIDISSDCGNSYTPSSYFKAGTDLATVPDQTGSWAPLAASDWRNDTLNLSPYTGSEIIVKFVNVNGYGNNLYIDNINVDAAVGLTSPTISSSIRIFPNPSSGLFTIDAGANGIKETSLTVTDIQGREVWSTPSGMEVQSPLFIDLRNSPKGVYLLQIRNGNGIQSIRLTVI